MARKRGITTRVDPLFFREATRIQNEFKDQGINLPKTQITKFAGKMMKTLTAEDFTIKTKKKRGYFE